jgi:hypothetical protein
MKNFKVTVALVSSLFASMSISQPARGESAKVVQIHGGKVPILMFQDHQAELEKICGCKLVLKHTSASIALRAVNKNLVSGDLIGLKLEKLIANVKAESGDVLKAKDFTTVKIGDHTVLFLLHSTNPSTKLTFEQLKGLLTGEIKNWKSINGMNEPVEVIINTTTQGANNTVFQKYLGGKEPSGNVMKVTSTAGFIKRLSITRGAIGISPDYVETADFKPKSIPSEGTIPLSMVAKLPLSPEMQKLFDYFKSTGGIK